MEYDPVKDKLSRFFGQSTFLQKVFYTLIDLLLLRSWHIHRELRLYARENKGHRHVLDAGSGLGQYAYWVANRNPEWSIVGIDVKKDEVARCNQFFRKIGYSNVIFKTGDLLEYRQENCYDLSLCVDVLEHIEEDVKVMRNLYFSLKDDGVLLISTPSDQGGSDVKKPGDTSFIEEHVRDGYNIKEIKEKLKNAGFKRVKARYTYGKPGQLSWKISMKYPILLLNATKLAYVILPVYYLILFPFCYLLNYIDTHSGHTHGTGLIVKAWK